MLNGAPALLAAHDKLLTARLLRRAGLPHPRTRLITGDRPTRRCAPPVVVKPRFGSWGSESSAATTRSRSPPARRLPDEPWYRRTARSSRSSSPISGFDLRIVVADDHVIGAISRVAAPGEWRTNVALGAERRGDSAARRLRSRPGRGAAATGASLVGVDLLPDGRGRWTVAEINGAVEFTTEYALRPGSDPFAEAASGSAGQRSAPGSAARGRGCPRSASRHADEACEPFPCRC